MDWTERVGAAVVVGIFLSAFVAFGVGIWIVVQLTQWVVSK